MKVMGSILLLMCSLWVQSAQASIFRLQQNDIGTDQVEISVSIGDFSDLLELYHLPEDASELNFTYLSGNISFSDAWDSVPLVPNTFQVNQQDVSSLQLLPDAQNTLTIAAAFNSNSVLAENDRIFSFIVNRPQILFGDIFFNLIDIGAGEPIDMTSSLERLQEVEPNSLVYSQAQIAPVPLPGASLFLMTGMLAPGEN